MQSQNSSTKEGRKPLPLPWGFGSMAFHGRVWWLTWRDPEGEIHIDNSNTADAAEAQRIMAGLSLPRARALVALLERIANGEEIYQGDRSAGRGSPKPRKVGGDRRRTAKATRRRTRREKAPGGEA